MRKELKIYLKIVYYDVGYYNLGFIRVIIMNVWLTANYC